MVLIGFGIGSYVSMAYWTPPINTTECKIDYTYVNDTAGCESKQVIKKHLYSELVEKLETYSKQQNSEGKSKLIAIYFRDLNRGPTFGINERENFAPASLLKVPLLMTVLNLAEENPVLLEKKASYSKLVTTQEQTTYVPPLEKNTPYRIRELLERMIMHSDNASYWLLEDFLSTEYPTRFVVSDTLKELGILSPRTVDENTITVKEYASLFRQLYNATYLSPDMSEYALGLLSKSTFKAGLVAGVPQDIKVAHKFGEKGLSDGEKQLHDCGIVYYPGNPYLICVMTKGKDFTELSSIIKAISMKVYEEIDSRKL